MIWETRWRMQQELNPLRPNHHAGGREMEKVKLEMRQMALQMIVWFAWSLCVAPVIILLILKDLVAMKIRHGLGKDGQ